MPIQVALDHLSRQDFETMTLRFDFGQVTEQQLQHASRHDPGRVIRASSSRIDEIDIQKRFGERIGDLSASGDSAFDQKCVELATLAQNSFAPITGISLGFEISGKAIEVRTERAASEVNERAFFFVPVFEHKNGCRFLIETGGAKVNY